MAVVLFSSHPDDARTYVRWDAGLPTLSVPRTRRHDDAMAAPGRGRLGWAICVIATIALAAYMVSVGWSRADLIASVGAFFVAVAGLAVALATRDPRTSEKRAQIDQEIHDANAAGSMVQEAQVSSQDKVIQRMARITARRISQRVGQLAQSRALRIGRKGDRDGP